MIQNYETNNCFTPLCKRHLAAPVTDCTIFGNQKERKKIYSKERVKIKSSCILSVEHFDHLCG